MANSITSTRDDFARRLIAYEAESSKSGEGKDSRAFGVCEKLRSPLSRMTGVACFRSLLSRALALAGGEAPWLRALHIKADGTLEGLEELEIAEEKIVSGEVVLVARFIGLLVTFIGPTMTLELLQDVWPKMEDLNF